MVVRLSLKVAAKLQRLFVTLAGALRVKCGMHLLGAMDAHSSMMLEAKIIFEL